MAGRIVLLIVAALLLTGCGGGVEKDAKYKGAAELREAVIESGVKCPGNTFDKDEDTDSVKCDEDLILEVVEDKTMLAMAATVVGMTGGYASLTGPNWFIQGDVDTLDKLKEKMGGKLNVP